LRAHDIPVYIENASVLPTAALGASGMAKIFVPDSAYEAACDILDGDDDIDALEEPYIDV